jgi:hypothetical protein
MPHPSTSNGSHWWRLCRLEQGEHLVNVWYIPILLKARELLDGKITAWRDKDRDISKTGLHIFFGAYPNATWHRAMAVVHICCRTTKKAVIVDGVAQVVVFLLDC